MNVTVPVGAPLKEALDAAAEQKRSTIILATMEGTPWTSDGFRASWGKAIKKAGVVGVTFNDLRGTTVTRLALVGCTEPLQGFELGSHRARGGRADTSM